VISPILLTLIVTIGGIATIILIAILILFGKTIINHSRINRLARRGFHLVEYIGRDRARNYYVIRPDGEHFVLDEYYKVKTDKIGLPAPGMILKRMLQGIEKGDDKILEKLVYRTTDKTLRFGIQTITYTSKSVYPYVFKEKTEFYGAARLKGVYERILSFIIDRELKMWMLIITIIAGALVLGIILNFIGHSSASNTAQMWCNNYNITAQRLIDCVSKIGGRTI
jgi:hypothetical protein